MQGMIIVNVQDFFVPFVPSLCSLWLKKNERLFVGKQKQRGSFLFQIAIIKIIKHFE
jgi:hypothetical protein